MSLFLLKAPAQNSKLWAGLNKGSYEIGFTTLNLLDSSRQIYLDSIQVDRPIQISIWFPSEKGTEKMNPNKYFTNFGLYRDFSKKATKEITTWSRNETVNSIFSKTTNDTLAIDELFKIETEAYLNSPNAEGKFPLVFLMAHVSTDLFLLAEYLASRGFVVVSKYSDGLITNKWEGWNTLGNSVNNDLIDLAMISNFLSGERYIDFSNVALVGYHGTTEPLILYQLQNKNVNAVVSLDGGEVWSFNEALKYAIKEHPAWSPSKVTCPYLRIHSDLDLGNSMDFKYADWWFYKETSNPATFVTLPSLNHYDFLSFLNANTIVPGITGTKNENPKLAHAAICESIFHFLNSNLNNSETSRSWFQNTAKRNGFPQNFIKVDTRATFKF